MEPESSMAGEVQYKGWQIEPQSYHSDGARWRSKATVSRDGSLHTHPVFASLSMMFDTKELADAYAVKSAKKWIDDRDRG